jgi:hypothetical protein
MSTPTNSPYRVFLSFPLFENEKAPSGELVYTKERYWAEKTHDQLDYLLGIPTFFCTLSLQKRQQASFVDEIHRVLEEVDTMVIFLDQYSHYHRKYCQDERDYFLSHHPGKKLRVFLLLSSAIKEVLDAVDILSDPRCACDVFYYEDPSSLSEFFNTINHEVLGDHEKIHAIKICHQCLQLFHDGNEEGTICLHHSLEGVTHPDEKDPKHIKFICCNKEVELPGVNALPDFSPGCQKEDHHDFGNEVVKEK